ncbi:MAG: hypothetical protein ACHP9T_04680 [Caulobacterales bacterium]
MTRVEMSGRCWTRWLLAIAASALMASPGRAAAPAAPDKAPVQASTTVEGLTVTARNPEPEQLPAIVNRFVKSHGELSRIGQLSRWTVPVCPKVVGLAPAFDSFVLARVRRVAADVGAPVDKKSTCKPNLLIAFTTKPQDLLDNVRKRHPQMLGFHYAAQTPRLATFSHAFQAWYMTGTAPEGGLMEIDSEFTPMPGGTAGSRLTSRLTSQFVEALVIMDSRQAVGHQIGAIADHVAMLSLARASDVSGCSALPSILDFLNPDCAAGPDVDSITPYDTAYLKGLYSINLEAYAAAQRSEIGSRMLREIATH